MVAERRLIPFLGAGFSAVQGLPGWEALLRHVSAEVQETSESQERLTYEEIREACDGDHLRVAEYLHLISGGSIGPVRHAISNCLRSNSSPIKSTAHVELVNLDAAQVYTTNFDDLIESVYRSLEEDADVVALPRDVARSHADRTQVVKYHGDLRHDETLVVTESQYYTRLDLESPMDLKFRSDLLGRSVLFIGYSFSDINIRVIWFKLMRMMQDVPERDRLPSYIVRLRTDPVTDRLYEAVGLRPVVLDPEEEADSDEARAALLAEFMLELAIRADDYRRAVLGTSTRQYVSPGLVSALRQSVERVRAISPRAVRRSGIVYGNVRAAEGMRYVAQMGRRKIPSALVDEVKDVFDLASQELPLSVVNPDVFHLVRAIVSEHGGSSGATATIARAMTRSESRGVLLEHAAEIDWARVWSHQIGSNELQYLLATAEEEVDGHEWDASEDDEAFRDKDLAYVVDLLVRVGQGSLAGDLEEAVAGEVQQLLARVTEMYPAAADYEPSDVGPPSPVAVCDEIDVRVAAEEQDDE
jgi:hypothetical protein